MRTFLLSIALFISAHSFSQTPGEIVFQIPKLLDGREIRDFYSGTDFDLLDTVSLWNYDIDTSYHGLPTDSARSIARIIFFRTAPIKDSIQDSIYWDDWIPFISFRVFYLKDSTHSFILSRLTHSRSSCMPPQQGGDLIIAGNLILVNTNVCTSCLQVDKFIDRCRPLINHIFSFISFENIWTIDDLVKQFIIRKGKWAGSMN